MVETARTELGKIIRRYRVQSIIILPSSLLHHQHPSIANTTFVAIGPTANVSIEETEVFVRYKSTAEYCLSTFIYIPEFEKEPIGLQRHRARRAPPVFSSLKRCSVVF
jgi:hypothetical protein